jgi:acetyl esterase
MSVAARRCLEGGSVTLGPVARTRIVLGRPAVRWLMSSLLVRRKLLAERATDLARGLDPDIAVMLGLDARTHDSHLWKLSPRRARGKMQEGIALVDDPPEDAVDTRALHVAGAAGDLDARAYTPRGLVAPSPGVVFLHGGGWVLGNLATHDSFCRRAAAHGQLRVVAVNYRLAPEHPFPAAAEDAVAAFRSIAARAGELGLDPARLAVAGDSAGGNLSAVVGLATRGDAVRPALQVLLYAALDATRSLASHTKLREGFYLSHEAVDWYYRHYMGRADPRDPRLSPLHAEDLRGAPPALVAIASFDPLVDEQERYVERLREAGVNVDRRLYPGLIHGFVLMTGLSPAARRATLEVIGAVGQHLRQVNRT